MSKCLSFLKDLDKTFELTHDQALWVRAQASLGGSRAHPMSAHWLELTAVGNGDLRWVFTILQRRV